MAALGATGATTLYFSPQSASSAERMNSVCCGIPATLVLSGYVTSGAQGYGVLALRGVTFPVSVCMSEDQLHGGDVVVIQEGISALTVSYLMGGGQSQGRSCLCQSDAWPSGLNSRE